MRRCLVEGFELLDAVLEGSCSIHRLRDFYWSAESIYIVQGARALVRDARMVKCPDED